MTGTATFAGESGRRRKNEGKLRDREGIVEAPPLPRSRALTKRWAHDIGQVYTVGPLLYPQCGESMRVIAFTDQAKVIEAIPSHVGLWPPVSQTPPRSAMASWTTPAARPHLLCCQFREPVLKPMSRFPPPLVHEVPRTPRRGCLS